MVLHFDSDFDGGAWPGPLVARRAVAGERWVGPLALLEVVETALGLRRPDVLESQRLAQLARAAAATEGFWSESAKVDPLGVARRLLSWDRTLKLHGWRGQPVAPRLDALHALTREVARGFPERLQRAADAAAEQRTAIDSVVLHEPLSDLPSELRRLLQGLARHGTRLEEAPVGTPVSDESDLCRARAGVFEPRGDGSLQLLRPYGPLEAADAIASALAALPSLDGIVVIDPDPALDAALRRHGLPTLGAVGGAADNALLQLLPLILSMGFRPADPQRALELLTLPASPVPPSIARRLCRALHEMPAVDSDDWRAALENGLAAIAEHDEERVEVVRERLRALFSDTHAGPELPVSAVRARTRALSTWLHGRAALVEPNAQAWYAAIAQVHAFETLVDLTGRPSLSPALLARYVEEANRGAPGGFGSPRLAGLATVSSPGAIAGPCEQAIWWRFDLPSAPRQRPWPFTSEELAALAKLGVLLPEPAELSLAAARRWRRPLHHAARRLTLVCPERAATGEELHPHPLWDELSARVPGGGQERALKLSRLIRSEAQLELGAPVARSPRELAALPEPRRTFRVEPTLIARRDVESPSSAAALLDCSLRWTLQYLGKVKGGATAQLPAAEQLLGKLAHGLLERVLKEAPDATPAEAVTLAGRLFDLEGPRLAAPLFLPGADGPRSDARRTLLKAAEELFSLLRDGGLAVSAVEVPIDGEGFGTRLVGKPDLVVVDREGRKAVIDLKWGGLKKKREALQGGTAHQLASYGALLRQRGQAFPPSAFFILGAQALLTTDPAAFRGGNVVDGPQPEETWTALVSTHESAWARLAKGVVEATALDEDGALPKEREDALEDGVLSLAPLCKFCEFDALCGRVFAPAAEEPEAAS